MGGGDWVEQIPQQQIQRVRPIKKAHIEVKPKEKTALYKAIDFLDDFIPQWILMLAIIVGLVTIMLAVFRKQINVVFSVWLSEMKKRIKK